MTNAEAKVVVALIREAAVMQDLPDAHLDALERAIEPLPYDDVEANVRRWAAAVKTDKDGQRAAKFVSSIDDVLDACGLPAGARHHLTRAHEAGGMVLPSLRDRSGWEYVAPSGEVPRGVGEFYAVAKRPLPTGDRPVSRELSGAGATGPKALPSGQSVTAVAVRMRREMVERRRGQIRILHPSEVEGLPPALKHALDAAEAAKRAADAAAFGYREAEQELRRQIRESAPDVDTAREVAAELLERVAGDPLGGMVAALDTVRDGLMPGAEVAFEVEHEFKNRGPVVGLKVYFERPAPKPAKTAAPDPAPSCPDCGAARHWVYVREGGVTGSRKVAVCRACGSTRNSKRSS